jgi:hypothetical protein
MVTTATGIATSFIQFSRASLATVTNNVGNIAWAGHNLIPNSESFDAASWSKGNIVTTGSWVNTLAAPNGTTTADLLRPSTSSATHHAISPAITSNATVTYSVYAYAGGYTKFGIRESGSSGAYASFDLTGSGSVLASASAGTVTMSNPQITPIGGGWFRTSVTFVVPFGIADSFGIWILPDSYTTGDPVGTNWSGDGTKGIYVWGASVYRSDLGGMVFNPAQPAGFGTYYPTTPPNLLGFTEDWSNAAWTKTGIRAFGSGSVSNAATAPNGLSSADLIIPDTSTGFHFTKPVAAITVPTNTPYTYSAYVKPFGYTKFALRETVTTGVYASFLLIGGGSLIDKSASANATIIALSDGWYRITMTVAVAATSIGIGLYPLPPSYTSGTVEVSWTPNGIDGFYLWGAQLSDSASIDPYSPVYGAAPTAAAYYAPRLDYSPTTIQPLGMLVEEQRVNFLRYSRTLETTGSFWISLTSGAANTIAINNAPGPDGLSTSASLITYNTAVTGVGTYSAWRQLYTTTANGTYTFSVWLRAGTNTSVYIRLNDSGGNRATTLCNLTSSWQRFTVTGTTVASITVVGVDIGADGNVGGATMTAGTVYAYGAQLESGSFATSYIPTGASTETRSADVPSVSTQAFPYSATEGTLVANGSPLPSVANTTNVIAELGDGGATNLFEMYRVSGTTNGALYVASGGVGSTITISNAFPANAASKFGGVYKVNDFQAAANGTLGTPVTSGAVPTAASNLYLGKYGGGTTTQWNGHIRQITYLPRRITNAELQTRST